MTKKANENWNDKSRQELRESLKSLILGEIRLANSSNDKILETCCEVYIQEDCPEDEWTTFSKFAADQIEQLAGQHRLEQYKWPAQTDCDKLDIVEEDLRISGILLWQVSPCCDTCSGAELPERIDEIDQRYPGFRDNVRGYAFFIDQNMPEMLSENTKIAVYLAYGWFSPDDTNESPENYEKNALGIAHEICECFRKHGFEPDWEGDISTKIGISVNWQRKTLLR